MKWMNEEVTSVFCLPLVVRKCQLSWFWLQICLFFVFLIHLTVFFFSQSCRFTSWVNRNFSFVWSGLQMKGVLCRAHWGGAGRWAPVGSDAGGRADLVFEWRWTGGAGKGSLWRPHGVLSRICGNMSLRWWGTEGGTRGAFNYSVQFESKFLMVLL